MDCKTFRAKYQEYSRLPLPRQVWETAEWLEWRQLTFECQDCSDWDMGEQLRQRNHDPSEFPCVHIAYYVTETCNEHSNYYDCPKTILAYNGRFGEYSIAPRGGKAIVYQFYIVPGVEFSFQLPPSKRKLWFYTLESNGINFPEDDIPEKLMKPKLWLTV